MAFYLAHAGAALQKMSVSGDVSTLTLPTGVTVSASVRSQFGVLNSSVLVTNGPSINLRIDPATLGVIPMSPIAPTAACVAGLGAAGVLTGDYIYKYTHAVMSGTTVISESPLSAASNTLTTTAAQVSLTGITVSTDTTITSRRIYRTVAGGTEFFYHSTIANNTATTLTDNTADAGLDTAVAYDDLGNPPGSTSADRMTLLTVWKDRAWCVGTPSPDLVYYSGINRWFAWSASNYLTINPKGQGTSGITAFLPRRDELGVARQRGLWKIVGAGSDTYTVIQVINSVGVIAPLSVTIIRDVAYFLAEDGVYAWGADGLRQLSQGRAQAWFGTDDTFNRSRFPNAFGTWNQREDTYELHLTAAGSNVEDRWVSYDLQRQVWLGPHKTAAFTPSIATNLEDVYGLAILVRAGTNGFIYRANDPSYSDGASGIALDIQTGWLNAGAPSVLKYFGELTVLTDSQASGTLTITPTVGTLDSTAQSAISHSLTVNRARHRRLGTGEMVSLDFAHSTADEGCTLYGYEIAPVSIVGVR
jgi:hypothetical protein